ncbi:MAG: transporter suffix domain-containing protein [Solibacillus sp.]
MKKELVENKNKQKNPFLFKFGIGLLILYPLLWGIAVIVPFTPFPTSIKATIIPVSIVLGEIFFIIGVAFVGKEVVTKYKSKLNPKNWRRKYDRQ